MSAASKPKPPMQTRPVLALFILFAGLILLVLGLTLSISVGTADIHLLTVWEALFHFQSDVTQHQIIQELRLPRALCGALVGAGFAVAGAIMQGMTRNPLADPGLLGVNAGSGFVLALCFALWPSLPFPYVILFSFLGAGLGAGLVYGIGSLAKGGLTPVRLALAGAAVSALLVALSEGVAIYYQVGQELAYWYAGGVAGATWLHIRIMFPWIVAGLVAALMLSRSITVFSLGEEMAAGLGQRTGRVKLAGAVIVLILAGAAVSTVGMIGFIGLVIPHVARFLVGVDYRWIIPCSAVLGSVLMVFADIGARMINPPYETPVGALIALLGVPFFLCLARRERRELG
ncbi:MULTISPECIES: iron ABC transporter permease [unclassified Brevibacillus]|jgi:iron complex transport system permease protein|uniref:FecCD family ABC transporter permease n=2 Tax=unclassified Brevibacillus TaxID=2684853 RepID=UPI001491CE97|nr:MULTISPECIES: iron ABC transporter permease [unclassified Brevibacillus]MBR8660961.1 iron ABC transporter permease [Brevibacillus sp. NL20B1]NNV01143.1 iron ABC transporter permease [Brevibacillus sp. MCWH]